MSSSHSLPPHTPVSHSSKSEPKPKRVKQSNTDENNDNEDKESESGNGIENPNPSTSSMQDEPFNYSSLKIDIPSDNTPFIQLLTSRSTESLELKINNHSIRSIKFYYNTNQFYKVVKEVTKVLANKQNIDTSWLYAMRASAYCYLHEFKLAEIDYDRVFKRDTGIADRLKRHMANQSRFFQSLSQTSQTTQTATTQQEAEQKDLVSEPTTLGF